MFKKVLIANRGEIALRVIRACRELGHQDGGGLLARRTRVACTCASPTRRSASARRRPAAYLNIPAIISAAEVTGADAIHPGYGFLSENAHFAEICETCNITFIGPTAETIRLMGDKAVARKTMNEGRRAGHARAARASSTTEERRSRSPREIGYPVIIKAAAGGGGRGMRVARDETSASRTAS